MAAQATKVGGPELYNEVQRLIFEWRGLDAGDQRAMVPQLVKEIMAKMEGHDKVVASRTPEAVAA